jgi:hypothetical protein
MKPLKFLFTVSSLSIVLMMTACMTWAAQDQQTQQRKQLPTLAEHNAFQAAQKEKDVQAKLKLLGDFVIQYPESVLVSDIYREYYLTYFSMNDYPQTIGYVDKFLAVGDNIDIRTRLETLVTRASAFSLNCHDSSFQTPAAYAGAESAAAQGLQTLSEWQKPEAIPQEQFSAQKKGLEIIFASVKEIAEAGLAGKNLGSCVDAPGLNGADRFNHMINEIKGEESQSPRVR